ncbi:MAG TPA: sulfatase-like hydrolase/transferase, partial [Actinomycetota bacterium]|nr:sulfatase-like hydrolase/transferase [Actinomycetota bacterium]
MKIGRYARIGFAALLGTVVATVTGTGQQPRAEAPLPNVLIIVTDDQRAAGTLGVMDATRATFETHGARFTDAYATTPLCCPSRASIFTGRYAHNHQLHTDYNDSSFKDHADELQQSTLQRYLHDAGYTTGVYGKYFNGWSLDENPPYFDRWGIFTKNYYDTTVNLDGTVKTIDQYSTSFVANHGLDFIDQTESNDTQPWFLYLAPYAPHDPQTPAPKYRNIDVPKFHRNPATLEEDRRDKPDFAQQEPPTLKTIKTIHRRQLRTLLSVDDMVGRIFGTLRRQGEQNTLAFFIGDNGYLWGEHGLLEKDVPYTDSIRVPLMMRWPGHVTAGTVDDRIA